MVEWESGRPLGSKLCVAREVFFCDVLMMLPSDRNEDLKVTRLDIKEHCPRRACQSKCCVQSTQTEQVSSHDGIS